MANQPFWFHCSCVSVSAWVEVGEPVVPGQDLKYLPHRQDRVGFLGGMHTGVSICQFSSPIGMCGVSVSEMFLPISFFCGCIICVSVKTDPPLK